MVTILVRLGVLLVTLYAVSKWIIAPIVVVRITDAGLITAVVCSVIVLLTVVLPFVIKK